MPEVIIIEITLDRHDEFFPRKIGQVVSGVLDILEVYLMRFENEYLLKATTSDTRDFEAFLRSS